MKLEKNKIKFYNPQLWFIYEEENPKPIFFWVGIVEGLLT
jgi:hypothetical protein